MAELEGRIERMGRASALAVLILDIDSFKSINDRHGHVAGDDALRALAARVQSLLRPGDALGRMGGEEFMIVLDRARPWLPRRLPSGCARRSRGSRSRSMATSRSPSLSAWAWRAGGPAIPPRRCMPARTPRCTRPRRRDEIARSPAAHHPDRQPQRGLRPSLILQRQVGAGGGTRTPTGKARRIFLPTTAFAAAPCRSVWGLDYPFTLPR